MRAGLLALLLLGGCSMRARITTDPPGGMIELPDGRTLDAPAVVRAPWIPLRDRTVEVVAPGYRTTTLLLRRGGAYVPLSLVGAIARPLRATGIRRVHLEVVLVPEHPPAGAWTPESEGLNP